jgi:hypothetical protein
MNKNPLHLTWLGRQRLDKERKKKERKKEESQR